MHRAFVEPSWIDTWLKDPQTPIPPSAIKRLVHIVRVKNNEEIALFDGCARQVRGYLSQDSLNTGYLLKDAQLEQISPSSPLIILAQAALVESKISETLRRGCEFGVDKFIIYKAQKSTAFCFEKLKKRAVRLEAILLDSARQSERLIIPSLCFAESFDNFLGPQGVFGDLDAACKLSDILGPNYSAEEDFLIIVGPEGGLSDQEKQRLEKAQLKGVRWGPYTQRTELAGLSAIILFNALCKKA